MAFTSDDLDKLDRAIAGGRGARSITFSDQTVTFNSIDDMLRLRALMKAQTDPSAATHRLATTDKGV